MTKRHELAGKHFDQWTVIRYCGDSKWLCRCSCGREKLVDAYRLTEGLSASCGKGSCRKTGSGRHGSHNRVDLTGKRFTRWTVVRYVRTEHQGKEKGVAYWLCRCDCGVEKEVSRGSLKCGSSKSCGCLKREMAAARKFNDLTGRRFGKLVVLSRAETRNKRTYWLCRCDCGTEKVISGHGLTARSRSRQTRSCGCIFRDKEYRHGISIRATRHGHYRNGEGSLTYRSWTAMKRRCFNKENHSYPNYGGRGITVCERWLVFENFLADMGPRPKRNVTLHRIDADGNYEPNNCKWASYREQARERDKQALITYTPPPLPPFEGFRVKFKSEYADMELGFGDMIKATQQAEQWRKEYPNAIVTIELPMV
jgi:hypothetical protein